MKRALREVKRRLAKVEEAVQRLDALTGRRR